MLLTPAAVSRSTLAVSSSGCSWKRRVSSRAATPKGVPGPAHDAIDGMPAVIEQDAAARHRRINAPVRDAIRADRDRRLSPERAPANRSHSADCAFVDQVGDFSADRRLEPIMHRMHNSPGARSGRGDALRVLNSRDQRLLAQHMQARVERPLDQRRMTARRARRCRQNRAFRRLADHRRSHATGHRDRRRERPRDATRWRRSQRQSLRRSRARQPDKWPLAATLPKPINAPLSTPRLSRG